MLSRLVSEIPERASPLEVAVHVLPGAVLPVSALSLWPDGESS